MNFPSSLLKVKPHSSLSTFKAHILQLGQAVEEEVMIENRREGSVASPYACEMEMLRLNIRIDFGYFIYHFYLLFTSTSITMYIIYTDPNSQGLQNIFKIWVTFNFYF